MNLTDEYKKLVSTASYLGKKGYTHDSPKKKVKGGGAGAGLAVGEGGRGGRSSGGGGDKVERKEWQRVLDLYFQLAAANLAEED